MIRLVLQIGARDPLSVDLGPGTYTIGREEGNAIVIDLPRVGARHLEIRVTSSLQTFVRALQGDELNVNGRTTLESFVKPGDIVSSSGMVLLVESVDHLAEKGSDSGEVVESFGQQYWRALTYPANSDAMIVVFGTVLIVSVASLMGTIIGWIAGFADLLVGLYILLLFRDIILTTVHGEDQMPTEPSVAFTWDDLRETLVPLYAATLIPALPFILVGLWTDAPQWLQPVLGAAAFCYIPMALLLLLVTGEFWAAHPLNVVLSCFRAPLGYLAILIPLSLLVGVGVLLDSSEAGVRSGARWLMVGKNAILYLAEVYLMFVWARILGLYYRHNRERLGWEEV